MLLLEMQVFVDLMTLTWYFLPVKLFCHSHISRDILDHNTFVFLSSRYVHQVNFPVGVKVGHILRKLTGFQEP